MNATNIGSAKTGSAKTGSAKTEPAKTEPAKTEPAKTGPARNVAKPAGQRRSLLDAAAVVLSATCALHCLALPVIVSLLPVATVIMIPEQTFHLLMLFFILPASLTALWLGCHRHKDAVTLLTGTLGISILTLTAFWGHQWFGLDGERLMTSAGGLILALAHVRNYLLCRQDNCAHE